MCGPLAGIRPARRPNSPNTGTARQWASQPRRSGGEVRANGQRGKAVEGDDGFSGPATAADPVGDADEVRKPTTADLGLHRAQAHALSIRARAEMRLAEEYDAAQERGEISKQGAHVSDGNMKVEEIIPRKDLHEARQMRDAEAADPGIVDRAVNDMVDRAEMRLAEEYDAAQERGEIRRNGERSFSDPEKVGGSEVLPPKDLHEARQMRDAEAAALASYAKQAEDETMLKMAARIRARAVRRSGELLRQIQPAKNQHDASAGAGGGPGSRGNAAREAGMSPRQAKTATRVANVPEDEFEAQVESDALPIRTHLPFSEWPAGRPVGNWAFTQTSYFIEKNKRIGSGGRDRTYDQLINSQLLYR